MPSATTYAECGTCHARIQRARLPGGATITLDWRPDPQGVIAASCDHLGRWTARRETPGIPLRFPEKRYAVHDCQQGAESPPEPAPGAAQLANWRKAVSGRGRRQRAGRGRRSGPGVTGVRWGGPRG